MVSDNDNYSSEQGAISAKAKEMAHHCLNEESKPSCSLLSGGACPLLNSAMLSLRSIK